MKDNDKTEILDFDFDKPKVGRPKLADKKLKNKSLIIALCSFIIVILLLIFGYNTLFGFRSLNLKGTVYNNESNEKILVSSINPIISDITIQEGMKRKLYLTVLPASANNKQIKYESNDKSVAIVDSNGYVTGISEGNTTITASTLDGSSKTTKFNVKVIKNSSGICKVNALNKENDGISYEINCTNADLKEVQYKIAKDDYNKVSSKKLTGKIKLSDKQLNNNITLKIIYYANNSSVEKYITKTIYNVATTTKQLDGSCSLSLSDVNSNSAKYDISCDNATVSTIAYKIGNGSYVGLDASSIADTIIFEESDVTRALYFKVEYTIDGSNEIKTISKNTIIERGK